MSNAIESIKKLNNTTQWLPSKPIQFYLLNSIKLAFIHLLMLPNATSKFKLLIFPIPKEFKWMIKQNTPTIRKPTRIQKETTF